MSMMYDMFGGMGQPMMPAQVPMNPMQRMQMVMSAMRNPMGYLKQKFPDIPDQYANNPSTILQYLQQTRGITNQDIQNVQAQMNGKLF